MRGIGFGVGLLLLAIGPGQAAGQTGGPEKGAWKAGVAVRVITPEEPLWMSGYAARNKPAEGKVHDLHVKALALEAGEGGRLLILTSDLVGIPRDFSDAVAAELIRKTGLTRERILLTVSHTHCGPVVGNNLPYAHDWPAGMTEKLGIYAGKLKAAFIEAGTKAVEDLKPARILAGEGKASFAVNRREKTTTGIKNGSNPEGPVDHSVPVLRVEDLKGQLQAVVFGYACHNTTLSFYKWCGDYAGFAQIAIEARHEGAVALFWTGCGADANPLPRGEVELAEKYGKQLADAVESALEKPRALPGKVAARYEAIPLKLGKLPTREQWTADLLSKNVAVRRRAEEAIKVLERGEKIPDHYPAYPVQVWRLGEDLLWVTLGGEVVVDYSHRLKKELGPAWVTAYANDVMAYIPSKRVLSEGGYEADSSMPYYGLPCPWAEEIEETIVGKVLELARAVRK